VHEPEKVQLLKAFAKVLGKRRVEAKDTVRLEQFQQAWRQFDVALSQNQCDAIFNKYGQVRFLDNSKVLCMTSPTWPYTSAVMSLSSTCDGKARI
jgi:hypothetical protein